MRSYNLTNHFYMPYIKISETDSFETAIRRFKRSVERSNLLTEMRARAAYEKPTTRRKREKLTAVRRLRRQLRLQSLPKRKY